MSFMPLFVVANWILKTCSCKRVLFALKKGFAILAGALRCRNKRLCIYIYVYICMFVRPDREDKCKRWLVVVSQVC